MASTNVTNIKNAFTLSSTLGADPGIQTSKDPTPLNPFVIITQTEAEPSEVIQTITTPTQQGDVSILDVNTLSIIKGAKPLYYQAGYYSTNSNSNRPQTGTIGYIIKQFLDKAFNLLLPKLTSKDIAEKGLTNISIIFASQESAIPNSDTEQAGNPPPSAGRKPFTPSIDSNPDHVGNLARARFEWCKWYIETYVKSLSNNTTLTFNSKNALKNISPEELLTKLKVDFKPIIIKPFTPYGVTPVEDSTYKNIGSKDVPPYFRNGEDNKKLYDSNTVSQAMKQQRSNTSSNELKTQLTARYQTEQRSNISFEAQIDSSKSEKKCDQIKSIPGKIGKSPDFENLIDASFDYADEISIQGMSYNVPDRFGILPYFSSTGNSDQRFLYGLILRLIDVSFPGSKAFKGVDYVNSFTGKTLYQYLIDSIENTNGNFISNLLYNKEGNDIQYLAQFMQWNNSGCVGSLRGVLTAGRVCDDHSPPQSGKFKKIDQQYYSDYDTPFGLFDIIEEQTSSGVRKTIRFGNDLSYIIDGEPDEKIENFNNKKFNPKFKEFIEKILENKIIKVEGYPTDPKDNLYVRYRQDKEFDKIFDPKIFTGNANEFKLSSLSSEYKELKKFPTYGVLGSTIFDYKRKCKF